MQNDLGVDNGEYLNRLKLYRENRDIAEQEEGFYRKLINCATDEELAELSQEELCDIATGYTIENPLL